VKNWTSSAGPVSPVVGRGKPRPLVVPSPVHFASSSRVRSRVQGPGTACKAGSGPSHWCTGRGLETSVHMVSWRVTGHDGGGQCTRRKGGRVHWCLPSTGTTSPIPPWNTAPARPCRPREAGQPSRPPVSLLSVIV